MHIVLASVKEMHIPLSYAKKPAIALVIHLYLFELYRRLFMDGSRVFVFVYVCVELKVRRL